MKQLLKLFGSIIIIFISNACGKLDTKQDALKNQILPMRERAEVRNKLLKDRFTSVLPEIMKRNKLDMWVIIAREYNEDPVIRTMLPATWLNARRRTVLVIFDPGNSMPLETYAIARYDVCEVFKKSWDPEKQPNKYRALADLIIDKNPDKIGINKSQYFAQADGLTAVENELFLKSLPIKYKNRVVSAEKVAIGWLETRSDM